MFLKDVSIHLDILHFVKYMAGLGRIQCCGLQFKTWYSYRKGIKNGKGPYNENYVLISNDPTGQ